jgi:hypothetical protein
MYWLRRPRPDTAEGSSDVIIQHHQVTLMNTAVTPGTASYAGVYTLGRRVKREIIRDIWVSSDLKGFVYHG